MKVSKETSAKHRDDLLNAASRLFRDRGFDKVGIAEIAREANLTHGAFYSHFESKEALCSEVIASALRPGGAARSATSSWGAYVEAYLSPKHARDRANGCPFAALAGDVPRASEAVREGFSEALDRSIERIVATLAQTDESASRNDAIEALATLVGALVLSRTAATPRFRDEILSAARKALLDKSG